MTAHSRAWESAIVLLDDYADRLSIPQLVACHVAIMAGPLQAPLAIIPLAAQVIGRRA